MTNPLIPPPELVDQWFAKALPHYKNGGAMDYVAQCAAQWGADQELEGCIAWLDRNNQWARVDLDELREGRRPNPQNLKEQAFTDLAAAYNDDKIDDTTYEIIRRALEQLDD